MLWKLTFYDHFVIIFLLTVKKCFFLNDGKSNFFDILNRFFMLWSFTWRLVFNCLFILRNPLSWLTVTRKEKKMTQPSPEIQFSTFRNRFFMPWIIGYDHLKKSEFLHCRNRPRKLGNQLKQTLFEFRQHLIGSWARDNDFTESELAFKKPCEEEQPISLKSTQTQWGERQDRS